MSHHDKSRRYHDRVARQYDSMYEDSYWEFHDELTWRLIKPHLPRDLSVQCADLGCGTGKWGLKLLKTGFHVAFLDHSSKMIEQVQQRLDAQGPRAKRATTSVDDIVSMQSLADGTFGLVLAMGDPLSICSDPQAAAFAMNRICAPGGLVIATADSKLAATEHFIERGNLAELEKFIQTGKTNWLTKDQREQFELSMFTPATLSRLFEKAGFEVVDLVGKPVINVRANRKLLESEDSIERLLKLEELLQKDKSTAAAAGHLQIVARKKSV